MQIEYVLPERANDEISNGLRLLTKALCQKGYEEIGGVLGGSYGYGTDFENKTFLIRPQCWCEKEECKKCSDEIPNFYHKPTDLKITWYKYIGRGMEINREVKQGEWDTIMADCLSTINF